MLLFSGLVGLASAQPGAARSPHVLASVEVGATPPRLGDPARGELGVALAWLASPWFAVELGGSFYPDLGRGEMDERLQRLQERLYPASITKVQFSAQALTVFSPIHGRFHSKLGSTFSLDLGLGFGLVQTAEDLDALDADGDSLALATANQVHPTLTWMAGPRIGLGKQLSATIRVRGAHWIETVESLYLEQMSVLHGTVGIARAF